VQKVGDCGIAFVSEKLTEDVKFLLDTMGFTVSKVFSCTRSNAHFKRGSKKETTLYHIIVSNPEQIKMKIGSYKKLSMERMTRKNRHRYMFENRFLDCSTIPIKDTRTFGLNRVHDVVALGEEHVYDLRVEGAHNFIANNIVVHNSLGYDDVLDGDLLRRGKPSAHAMFGAGAAMMGSNLLALLALKMGTVRGLPLIRLLISAASNLALGSTEEQLFHEYSEDRYYRIIGLKTASLFQAPCEIGAIVAGVVRPQFVLASRYGWNVGMLYQITDDLVDILKTHLTGEPHGHMKNGSPTLAFIHAARTTKDSHIGTLLQKFINDAPLPMEEFEEVYKALVAAGSIEYTFKKIEEHNKLCHKQCALMPQNKFSNYLAAMPGYMHRALMSEVKGYEGLEGMKAPETPESKEPEKPAGV
jgi:geranylgeranyl pyrophosphate synthase